MDERQELEELRRLEELERKQAAEKAKADIPNISKLSSGMSGALHGATMGFSDELLGAIRALSDVAGDKYEFDDLLNRYAQRRNEFRKYNEMARQANPATYTTGEIGGGVASALIPGAGLAKGASLGKAALQGGIAGLGTSEADLTKGDIAGAAEDVALGAGLGAGMQAGVSVAGKALSQMSPSRLAKSYLGLPEPAYQQYIKSPEGVKAALAKREDMYGLPELAQRLSGRVDELAEEAVSGSQAGRHTLEFEGTKLPQAKLREYLQSKIDEIAVAEGGIPNDAYAAAKAQLQHQMGKLPKDLPEVTGPQWMDRVRELRKATDFNQQTGAIDTKSGQALKDVAYKLDQELKGASPAYTTIMQDAAESAKLLERAKPLARTDQGAMNFLGAIDRAGSKFKADVLRDVDEHFADTIAKDTMDAITARAIDRSAPAGSQRVNMFANIGESLFGPKGKAVGAAFGGAVDAYGRPIAISMIEASAKVKRALQNNRITNTLGERATYALEEAAKRGDPALVLTFQLLSRENPELLKVIEEP